MSAHKVTAVRDFRSSANRAVTLDPAGFPLVMQVASGHVFHPDTAGINYSTDLGNVHVYVSGKVTGWCEFPLTSSQRTGFVWENDDVPAELRDLIEQYRPQPVA